MSRSVVPRTAAGWGRLALFGSVAVLGLSATGAWRVADPTHPAAIPPEPLARPDSVSPPPRLGDRVVLAAIAAAPFRPDRQRVPQRYRLPGERVAVATTRTEAPATVRLLGTAVLPAGGGIAALEVAGVGARLASVGQQVGPYRLIRVARGEVTLEGPDSTMVVRIPQPGERGGTP